MGFLTENSRSQISIQIIAIFLTSKNKVFENRRKQYTRFCENGWKLSTMILWKWKKAIDYDFVKMEESYKIDDFVEIMLLKGSIVCGINL